MQHQFVFIVISACVFSYGCGNSGEAPRTAGAASALAPNGASAGLPSSPGLPRYSLDRVGEVTDPFSKQPISIPSDKDLELSGFALDELVGAPAAGVDVVVDGAPFAAHYGTERGDVANYFKKPGLANTGYSFSMAARWFGAGKHQVTVRVISADKKRYQESPALAVEIR